MFTDLVGMSSPPHDVAMRFGPTDIATIPRLVNAMKEILVQYYERKGLIHPRKVNHLAISYNSISYKPGGLCIVINSRSHSTPRSNLRFQFEWTNERERDIVVKEGFPPFLLDDVREFAVECSVINKDEYRGMFQKMKNLSHLELDELNIQLVLDVLSTDNHGMFKMVTKTTLIHLHVLRWATTNPQAGVVDLILPLHPPRLHAGAVGYLQREA